MLNGWKRRMHFTKAHARARVYWWWYKYGGRLANGRWAKSAIYRSLNLLFCKNASSDSNIVNTTSVPSLPYFILVVWMSPFFNFPFLGWCGILLRHCSYIHTQTLAYQFRNILLCFCYLKQIVIYMIRRYLVAVQITAMLLKRRIYYWHLFIFFSKFFLSRSAQLIIAIDNRLIESGS